MSYHGSTQPRQDSGDPSLYYYNTRGNAGAPLNPTPTDGGYQQDYQLSAGPPYVTPQALETNVSSNNVYLNKGSQYLYHRDAEGVASPRLTAGLPYVPAATLQAWQPKVSSNDAYLNDANHFFDRRDAGGATSSTATQQPIQPIDQYDVNTYQQSNYGQTSAPTYARFGLPGISSTGTPQLGNSQYGTDRRFHTLPAGQQSPLVRQYIGEQCPIYRPTNTYTAPFQTSSIQSTLPGPLHAGSHSQASDAPAITRFPCSWQECAYWATHTVTYDSKWELTQGEDNEPGYYLPHQVETVPSCPWVRPGPLKIA
jgi:hypothetical protein